MAILNGLRAGLLGYMSLAGFAGPQSTHEYAPPIHLPADRVTETYAVYSLLLPSDVIEWGNVSRTQWLLEDITTAEPLATTCANTDLMNPHQGIKAPDARRTDFDEVLTDFDAHCHDRYRLQASSFHLKLPVRLLNEEDRNRFVKDVSGSRPPANDIMRAPATPDEFKGAAGMHSFTAVYFNRNHTLAMTEIGMYCGALCGNWSWAVLERTPAGWRTLPWAHTSTIP